MVNFESAGENHFEKVGSCVEVCEGLIDDVEMTPEQKNIFEGLFNKLRNNPDLLAGRESFWEAIEPLSVMMIDSEISSEVQDAAGMVFAEVVQIAEEITGGSMELE